MKAGLTQKDVASAIGVNVSSYANAENYGRSLGRKSWYELADFFNVDPRVLEGKKLPLFSENSLPKG